MATSLIPNPSLDWSLHDSKSCRTTNRQSLLINKDRYNVLREEVRYGIEVGESTGVVNLLTHQCSFGGQTRRDNGAIQKIHWLAVFQL